MKTIISLLILLITISINAQSNKIIPKQNTEASYLQSKAFAKLNLPFSQAVRHGNILYLSGQIGTLGDTDSLIEGGIIPETKQTMLNIKKVLEENGSSLDKILKCTCMLADIKDWAQMSAEYLKFFPNHKPARSAFAATGLALGARVEIECIAYLD